jgi:hypothetical protein
MYSSKHYFKGLIIKERLRELFRQKHPETVSATCLRSDAQTDREMLRPKFRSSALLFLQANTPKRKEEAEE